MFMVFMSLLSTGKLSAFTSKHEAKYCNGKFVVSMYILSMSLYVKIADFTHNLALHYRNQWIFYLYVSGVRILIRN